MDEEWRFEKVPPTASKPAVMRAPTRSCSLFGVWRRFEGDRLIIAKQHSVWDPQDEGLLGGIIGQRNHATAILQESKHLPIPVEMDIDNGSEYVTRV